MRNLDKVKKANEAIKYRIIGDITTLFKQKDYYLKQLRVGNFSNNSYIEYENSGDRNKNRSVKEYLKNKLKPTGEI